jgi:hypothetical protein
MPRRETGRLLAGLTSLLVALCTTCGLAPVGTLQQALAAATSSAAPMCDRSGDCGSSCPEERDPRPSDCRSCSTTRCGFLVSERVAPSAPASSALGAAARSAPVVLSTRAAALRDATLAASPPLHLLHETFRN